MQTETSVLFWWRCEYPHWTDSGAQMSTRSIMYAEPICLDNEAGRMGVQALIQQHDRDMCRNALFGEIRPNFNNRVIAEALTLNGYKHLGYLNYEIDLKRSEDELFRNLNCKRRNNVRSAIRRGVEVQTKVSSDGVDELYRLISYSYNRSKILLWILHCSIPLLSKSILHNIDCWWPTIKVPPYQQVCF